MNKRLSAIAIMSTLALGGCGWWGSYMDGQGTYPSAGPVPPVGTVWETIDGSAGVRLATADTAEVWGLPWYGGEAGCYPEDLEYLHETVPLKVFAEPAAPSLVLQIQVDDYTVEWLTLNRDSRYEGWQGLTYMNCEVFNDGHNLELHMVGAASVPSSSSP